MNNVQRKLISRMVEKNIDLMVEKFDRQEWEYEAGRGNHPSPDLRVLAGEMKKNIIEDIGMLDDCICAYLVENIDNEVESSTSRCLDILKEGDLSDIYKEVEQLGEYLKSKISPQGTMFT